MNSIRQVTRRLNHLGGAPATEGGAVMVGTKRNIGWRSQRAPLALHRLPCCPTHGAGLDPWRSSGGSAPDDAVPAEIATSLVIRVAWDATAVLSGTMKKQQD